MGEKYFCKNEGRKRSLFILKDENNKPILNGIDYMEVDPKDQTTLMVYFIHNLPGSSAEIPSYQISTIEKKNILISGGVRIKNIEVLDDPIIKNNLLKVKVKEAGDFSNYKLSIVTSSTENKPPKGFDCQLSTIEFCFKINCPNDFDNKNESLCLPETTTGPKIDYLAKDYASFRRLILDRMSVLVPGWTERNPADLQIAMIELLAYTGDYLSYYQDAVATEAYLGTARKRISLMRHARLLDYFVHEGCNARTWITIKISESKLSLPEGNVLLTRGPDNTTLVSPEELDKILSEQYQEVFETKYPINLYKSQNEIHLYAWCDLECFLPKGSTKATLINEPELFLESGDVIIFEEIRNPFSPSKGIADPTHRHAVRLTKTFTATDLLNNDKKLLEIEWHETDKLPFQLSINTTKDGQLFENSIVLGNVVLADHGYTLKNQKLIPETAIQNTKYRPMLQHKGITASVQYIYDVEKNKAALESLIQDPHDTLPSISLIEKNESWSIKKDLLGTDRFTNEFVAEIEEDGKVLLRFGDDVMGRSPETGFQPSATYRIGNGKNGNVGPDTISRIVGNEKSITNIRNPLPASGGKDPESMEEIKEFAPQAFRKQERAVTEKDYAEKAKLHNEVQNAAAKFRWTGSWYTVFLFIDRKNSMQVDDTFKIEMSLHLEKYRMAGYDLEIMGPKFIPVDIVFNVCVKSGYYRCNIKENLLRKFSNYDLPDGSCGFFHPNNFTFGKSLFLSELYQCALQNQGVMSIEVTKFQRWTYNADHEIENGRLVVADLEIIRLDNDPNFPENGKIEFIMCGGL